MYHDGWRYPEVVVRLASCPPAEMEQNSKTTSNAGLFSLITTVKKSVEDEMEHVRKKEKKDGSFGRHTSLHTSLTGYENSTPSPTLLQRVIRSFT